MKTTGYALSIFMMVSSVCLTAVLLAPVPLAAQCRDYGSSFSRNSGCDRPQRQQHGNNYYYYNNYYHNYYAGPRYPQRYSGTRYGGSASRYKPMLDRQYSAGYGTGMSFRGNSSSFYSSGRGRYSR